MNKKLSWAIALFCLCFSPIPSHAQCKDKGDQFCRNLQYILYAAQTDFRPLDSPQQFNDFGLFKSYPRFPRFYHSAPTQNQPDQPDLSFDAAKVSCRLSAWTNGVSMYMCEGRIPIPDAEKWYNKTLAELQQLQYLWNFRVQSPGADHYVDGGPADCDIAATDGLYITDGPYVGQCPLHFQTVRQADGTDSVHLWVTSYSSPFLARRLGGPVVGLSAAKSPAVAAPTSNVQQVSQISTTSTASQSTDSGSAPAVRPVTASNPASASSDRVADKTEQERAVLAHASCDEFCQGLKKILEDRWTSFKELHSQASGSSASEAAPSPATIKLAGASVCSISALSSDPMRSASNGISRVRLTPAAMKGKVSPPPAEQYVCYWPESSSAAAESQFHALVSVLEFLIPSTWSAHQQNQTDELSGAQITVWSAHDAGNAPAIGLYLSGQSVGLHVTSASELSSEALK
jgi:hypothetical protein